MYLLGAIVSRIAAIVLIPLYTRRLTPDDYGEYSLVTSILQLLPTCGTLGLTAGLTRVYFNVADKSEAERATGAVSRGLLVIALVTMGLLAIGVQLFVETSLFGVSKRHLLLAIAAAVGAAVFTVPSLLFRAAQRPYHAVSVQLASFLLSAGLGVVFVLVLGRGLTGAVEAMAAAWGVIGVATVAYILSLPSGPVVRETKAALGFSVAFVPHFIGSWLQVTADRWVLTAYGATAALGTYYLAVQLASPIPMLAAAYNEAESPRHGEIYRAEGTEGAYRALRSLYRRYVVVSIAPAACLLLGAPLLPLIIGPKFTPALVMLPALGIAYVAEAFYYPASNYVFFAGRTTLIPIVTIGSAVVATALAIVLLPRFGVAGLLASRIAGAMIRSGAMMWAARLARPA